MGKHDEPLQEQAPRARRQGRVSGSFALAPGTDAAAILGGILGSLGDGVMAADDQWRLTFVNAAAAAFWDRLPEQLIGEPLFASLGLAADSPIRHACTGSREAGLPTAFVAGLDDSERWLEMVGSPHAQGYTLLLRDVSAVREAYRRGLEREQRLAARDAINQRIFDTTVDLILVVDRRGTFVRVSPSCRTLLGYEPEEMIGHSAAEFLHPPDLEHTRQQLRLSRLDRQTRHFDCRYVHRDGRIVALSWAGIWSEPEQQHFFIGRDMTEHRAAEERLRHAQRLDAVGKLTGGIAHDFNNILGVVIGNLDLLRERLPEGDLSAELADSAQEAALRGAEVTQRLLAFARRQELQPVLTDVRKTLASLIGLLKRTLGEAIEVETHFGEPLWQVEVDRSQLESAVVNLALNARDAMPDGGRLTIEVDNAVLDESSAAVPGDLPPGDYLRVSVSDTGEGIPHELLQRVFEPFFTTKGIGRGTGLGLSMVHGFVKQSDGHVTIYSAPGRGTTVRFYLPRAGATAERAEHPGEAMQVARGAGEQVLVVEDNAAMRAIIVQQLQHLGYRTLEAGTATEALRLVGSGLPIDLVFSDVVMPGSLNGFDLAERLLREYPGLRVLLSSGFTERAGPCQGQRRGEPLQVPLLNKPFRRDDLARAVRRTLEAPA